MKGIFDSIDIKQYLVVSVMSLVTALFAYLLLFFAGNYASLYFAYDFDIGAWFSLGGISFDIERPHHLWTYDAEVTIFLSKPLLSLVIGIISLIALILIKRVRLIFFFLLFWLNIFAFNAAFGLFVDDFISRTGLIFVAERMELGLPEIIFSLSISVFIMYRIGMVNSLIFGQLLPKKCKTNIKIKALIVLITIIMPWLMTGIIIIILSYPDHLLTEHLKTLSTAIIFIPFFFCKGKEPTEKATSLMKFEKYDWLIAFVILVLAFFLYSEMLNPIVIVG